MSFSQTEATIIQILTTLQQQVCELTEAVEGLHATVTEMEPAGKEFYTTSELAEVLGVSRFTVNGTLLQSGAHRMHQGRQWQVDHPSARVPAAPTGWTAERKLIRWVHAVSRVKNVRQMHYQDVQQSAAKMRQRGNAAWMAMMLLGSPNPLKQVGSTGFEPARDLTPTRPST